MATLRMCPKCGNRKFSDIATPLTATPPVMATYSASTHSAASAQAISKASSTLAGRGARLGAALLDFAIFFACIVPGIIVMSSSGSDAYTGFGIALLLFGWLGILIAQAIYLTKRGQSLGKMIVGVKIVRVSDESLPGFVKVFVLRLFVPGLLTGIPYLGVALWLADLLCIFRDDRRCIHDLIAETKVIDA